ncbi:MAG: hypothetical protein HYR74_03010 [Candidatus Eisenbacteria bacterium]|nr:hypothetical protein [Candidatus Eisenbacteria bacterium]
MTVSPAPAPRPPDADPRGRLPGAMLAGALLVPLLTLAVAALLALPVFGRLPRFLALLFTRALAPSGWIGLPLLGAGLGALTTLAWSGSAGATLRRLALAIALMVAGAALVVRTPYFPEARNAPPRGSRARMDVIRRSTFHSPADVARILPYTRDPDPIVRQQAVLACGVNVIVAGIEGATADHPSPFVGLPLCDSLRTRLEAALHDSVEDVRAEAARALWKAPRTFGREPAAAETLAAVLDRALRPGAVERLTWLALDAAAGAPDARLEAAAAQFAAACPDTELARAARRAVKGVAPASSER